MKSGQHEPVGGGVAVERSERRGVDCVVPDVVCDDLAAEGNITSPLPSGDTFQLVDEFIEEEREESNDPLEGDPKGGGTQQDEPELQDDNDEMEVKEEDVEEVVGAEELVKDEDVEELDDNQECRDYEADGEGGDMGMGEDD